MKRDSGIDVRWRCGEGGCRGRHRARLAPGENVSQCSACGARAELAADGGTTETITRCAVCGGEEFFIRKDFPQRFGLFLVILFALIASVFYYQERVEACFGVLAALVVIDAIIYLFVGRVLVCYRCRAEYRGAAYNAEDEGFDLATAEKYRT